MCGDCKGAMAERTAAAARLLDACSERFGVKYGLRLVYPPQDDLPADMKALAYRLGGG